jgi:hypothetical protein
VEQVVDAADEAGVFAVEEVQAFAFARDNPSVHAPAGHSYPARGYIPALYDLPNPVAAEASAPRGPRPPPEVSFEWSGALRRNESVVTGPLSAHVTVRGFRIPDDGILELYFQQVLAATGKVRPNLPLPAHLPQRPTPAHPAHAVAPRAVGAVAALQCRRPQYGAACHHCPSPSSHRR